MTDVSEHPAQRTSDVPSLSDSQWDRLLSLAAPTDVSAGDYVFRAGDLNYPMILVESGAIEMVRDPLWWDEETVLSTLGPRSFAGELGLLNGQSALLSARVKESGRIRRLAREDLRLVMNQDDDLGGIVLHTLWERREALRRGPAAMTLKFIGTEASSGLLALRRFAERLDLIHTVFVVPPDDMGVLDGHGIAADDLPAALIQGKLIKRATPGTIAERLGLSYQPHHEGATDLLVVGGGPAGLAAAIYAASEGLSTVVLDAVAPGGQAASTSRIENFLGFPFGVAGGDLIRQATLQAIKFGVRIWAPCDAVSLETMTDGLRLTLGDGATLHTRTALITSGAAYRSLGVQGWEDFEGRGIYYAATSLEVRQVTGHPVVVVGGANSAGQAALYLASHGCQVHLVVRGTEVGARMSSYLVDRLREDPRIRIHTESNIIGLDGGSALDSVRIDTAGSVDARGLFCFIGADPASAWLPTLDRDTAGFIRTGTDIAIQALDQWQPLGREPMPFETSTPGVFAAGDVRHGSMKRIAAAVGEGSSAVASVHRALGDPASPLVRAPRSPAGRST
ncbi:cyclic nucleotide-binding domain-containing thioredoxin-disulfide reductase [Arthrobacter sp. zg-Y238]|uniref:FAD-dependent oxidoreductase n=1 Tax=Arthrobacter sp. zg-Y238 TaxID=2964614 RepID=UPI0021053EE0|nr:cyclic nucleotide-binding domain-containing thioredoxin-disulfide reductase [Arthrobacter sp. zg-Y238]MCQ1954507.1 FAD-dependent oxidoreductase [Arthrobacter sp. zg-Y238]